MDAREEAIELMAASMRNRGLLGARMTDLATLALDTILSPRSVECETCAGTGVRCPSCSGSGRIEKGPIAYLADSLEQVGTLTEDYIDGEWRGRIAGYMTTNAIATRTVPLLRVRPDESPKGGA